MIDLMIDLSVIVPPNHRIQKAPGCYLLDMNEQVSWGTNTNPKPPNTTGNHQDLHDDHPQGGLVKLVNVAAGVRCACCK